MEKMLYYLIFSLTIYIDSHLIDSQAIGCEDICLCEGSIAFCYSDVITEQRNFQPSYWITHLGYVNKHIDELPKLSTDSYVNLDNLTITECPFITCEELYV